VTRNFAQRVGIGFDRLRFHHNGDRVNSDTAQEMGVEEGDEIDVGDELYG
jgi:hypothetical protein